MSDYAVINLKTGVDLKRLAMQVADKLGVSISAVLNNELRRFATEQSVLFDLPEAPNATTAKQIASSKKQIDRADYHKFSNSKQAVNFLADTLK